MAKRERERERDRREAHRPIFEVLVGNATFKTCTNLANDASCNSEDGQTVSGLTVTSLTTVVTTQRTAFSLESKNRRQRRP